MRGKEQTWLDQSRNKVCLCCHVRTGTIVLGIWHLLVELVVIGLLLIAIVHPDVLLNKKANSASYGMQADGVPATSDSQIHAFTYFRSNHIDQDQLSIALIVALLSFVVTIILVYGTIRYRAGYLMPFFCIQVFDFCLTCLSAVGFFSYVPGVKLWIEQRLDDRLPFKGELLAMDNTYLMLVLCVLFMLVLSLKAYLISMVWTCYTYIHKRNLLISTAPVDDTGEMALPPKYEDAIRAPMHDESLPPPPPYIQ